ncbi:MFS general substrate transporter [Xylariomycetidae sp. FL0641]|nr:MFS general substrate transporter [Xylariomycetidae sp. FL0641]
MSLCGHLVIMNTWGFINSFGVFQSHLLRRAHLGRRPPSDISWIGSVALLLSQGVCMGGLAAGCLFCPASCCCCPASASPGPCAHRSASSSSRPGSSRLVDWAAFRELEYTFYTVGVFFNFWGVYFTFYYLAEFSRTAISPPLSYAGSLNLLLILNGVGIVDRVGPLNSDEHGGRALRLGGGVRRVRGGRCSRCFPAGLGSLTPDPRGARARAAWAWPSPSSSASPC